MKDNYKEITVEHLQDELEAWKRMYKNLEEENKNLKEENEILKEYKLMYEGLIIN